MSRDLDFLCFQRLLTAFLNKLFTMKSFEGDFALVGSVDGIKGKNIVMPDGIRCASLRS